jgi:lipopolysaccharide transport system ATP-binding protein
LSDIAIRTEQLGKRYRLGSPHQPSTTLREALLDMAHAPLRLGERGRPAHTEFWALRDISLQVPRGEVLGIVGRNGAGKSTLLKLLSRVSRPTVGRAVVHGRVGSLLEVGTGFHPELSGRENIYLNGAILGMSRAEIQRRFDQIVEFAEIERFIDTPVKRYSSGMYMRLAFSIAAHVEPEILLVDEVLSVGDAAFQKRCLGKMDTAARDGRTVVFVSHNMPTVLTLCERAILLEAGRLVDDGTPAAIVTRYLASAAASCAIPLAERRDRSGDGTAQFVSLRVQSADSHGHNIIRSSSRLKLELGYRSDRPLRQAQFVVSISDQMDVGLFVLHNELGGGLPGMLPAVGTVSCITDPIKLTPGRCAIHLELLKGNVRADHIRDAASFDVVADESSGGGLPIPRDWAICVLPHRWSLDEA